MIESQDAKKFARHAKRTKVSIEDINLALRLRNFEVGALQGLWDEGEEGRPGGQGAFVGACMRACMRP